MLLIHARHAGDWEVKCMVCANMQHTQQLAYSFGTHLKIFPTAPLIHSSLYNDGFCKRMG